MNRCRPRAGPCRSPLHARWEQARSCRARCPTSCLNSWKPCSCAPFFAFLRFARIIGQPCATRAETSTVRLQVRNMRLALVNGERGMQSGSRQCCESDISVRDTIAHTRL